MIFDLQELVNMTSIGTLLAYTLVCMKLCICVRKYKDSNYLQFLRLPYRF